MAKKSRGELIEIASREPFAVYASLAEYLDHVSRPCVLPRTIDRSWAGASVEEIVGLCRRGDLAAVPEAENYANMINDAVDIAGRVPSWSLDVAGPFVCVPEFLAGSPECMYSPSEVVSTAAPLDVCICLGASGGVGLRDMRRRGVCVLAALLALSRVRDVRPVVFGRPALVHSLIRLSVPFDASELCAVLTQPAFYRALMTSESQYAANVRRGFRAIESVPRASWSNDDAATKRALIDLAGMSPDCLVIGSETANTWSGLSDDDFIAYLNVLISRAKSGL